MRNKKRALYGMRTILRPMGSSEARRKVMMRNQGKFFLPSVFCLHRQQYRKKIKIIFFTTKKFALCFEVPAYISAMIPCEMSAKAHVKSYRVTQCVFFQETLSLLGVPSCRCSSMAISNSKDG